MRKKIMLLILVVTGVLMSCQKDYVCFCSNVNSGISSYKERYVGTVFAKKTAEKSCKLNMDLETDSLTNCHIE